MAKVDKQAVDKNSTHDQYESPKFLLQYFIKMKAL